MDPFTMSGPGVWMGANNPEDERDTGNEKECPFLCKKSQKFESTTLDWVRRPDKWERITDGNEGIRHSL